MWSVLSHSLFPHCLAEMTDPIEETLNEIDGLQQLRQHHGDRRGQVAHIEHFLEIQDKTPLKHLSLTELTQKKGSLLEHEAIQCRIEQVRSWMQKLLTY